MAIQVILLIAGFFMLIKGADFFVDGAAGIAVKFKIPQIVIGLTIVAFGTSAPEAAISINAALSGQAGISIGNVVGSNIMNILLILGLTALVSTVPVKETTLKYELPFVVAITVILLALGMAGKDLSRMDGGIFWILFLAFFYYLIRLAKGKDNSLTEEVDETKGSESFLKLIFLTALGLVLIVFGSDVTVDAATAIAKNLGISDRIIGLTIVAFGTSLPELVTSVTAAFRGQTDIAIGNIVGSNIFNILFVIGTASIISPIPFLDQFIFDGVVAIAAALLLYLLCRPNRRLNKVSGVIMLLCYGAYCMKTIL